MATRPIFPIPIAAPHSSSINALAGSEADDGGLAEDNTEPLPGPSESLKCARHTP